MALTIRRAGPDIRGMELYLIRHAQSLNNALPEEERVEDPPLTQVGHREQARRLVAPNNGTGSDNLAT